MNLLIQDLGSVWLSTSECLALNWFLYQIILGIEWHKYQNYCLDVDGIARCNSSIDEYQIMFGCAYCEFGHRSIFISSTLLGTEEQEGARTVPWRCGGGGSGTGGGLEAEVRVRWMERCWGLPGGWRSTGGFKADKRGGGRAIAGSSR